MNGDSEVTSQRDGRPGLNHEPSSLASDGTIDIKTDSAPAKRKLDATDHGENGHEDKRRKGTAPIKEEYLLTTEPAVENSAEKENRDDDAAEALHHQDRSASNNSKNPRKKQKGQNKNRKLKAESDEVGLCSTRNHAPEFSPRDCPFGDKCRFEHDLRRYLTEGKRADLAVFDGICPVWKEKGKCRMGWQCRFVKSHSKEVEHSDGRKEFILIEDQDLMARFKDRKSSDDDELDTVNNLDIKDRLQLTRKKFPTPKSDEYMPYLEATQKNPDDQGKGRAKTLEQRGNSSSPEPDTTSKQDNASMFVDPPLLPSEKRRLYFGPDTPVLAPLTTQGNLPFRRLCSSLGASFTYSEMAMSLPISPGQRSEWALLKAHESEITPPTFISNDAVSSLKSSRNIVYDYNQQSDLRFGAQISANKPWLAIKTAEVLSTLLPGGLRVIDMNCGCPIDLVFKEGAGSALMDAPNKLDKMLRGMNIVSGAIPISCKIRMGTRTGVPTAQKLVERLVLGAKRTAANYPYTEQRETPSGVAAITLHGRSRQQRYTREADWEYISDTASLINSLNTTAALETDTIHAADPRDQPASRPTNSPHNTFFLGNGDVYSHTDYYAHLTHSKVDSVMLARGALIKPWLFEEIATNQYLDKPATERLGYIETFVRHGLSAWGSDTHGISTTRRFLLEYLSFTHRYVPIGLLEVLPPKINERPPRYKGRNELETLLASDSYKDWIKISEMFLGKVSEAEGKDEKDYGWVPKHKSHAWDGEAQG